MVYSTEPQREALRQKLVALRVEARLKGGHGLDDK